MITFVVYVVFSSRRFVFDRAVHCSDQNNKKWTKQTYKAEVPLILCVIMSYNRDLIQLKLQKKLLEEKLATTEHKIERYGQILDKKAAMKGKTLMSPEKTAITSFGLTVDELRIPPRACKAVPIDHTYDPYATAPEAVTNPNILRIRQTQRLKSDGDKMVKDKIKEKLEIERKNQVVEQRFPQIPIAASMLPNRYLRGELPCTIEHGVSGKYLSWASPLEFLDYEYYLPIFFDGLQVKDKIITFIACQGIEDMLYASRGHPDRIKSVIPLLVRPLRNALGKFDTDILLWTLKALQQLITCNAEVGEVLMPYGKQFLAPISLFMDQNRNIGDSMDYGQRKSNDIGEEVNLEISSSYCYIAQCC